GEQGHAERGSSHVEPWRSEPDGPGAAARGRPGAADTPVDTESSPGPRRYGRETPTRPESRGRWRGVDSATSQCAQGHRSHRSSEEGQYSALRRTAGVGVTPHTFRVDTDRGGWPPRGPRRASAQSYSMPDSCT